MSNITKSISPRSSLAIVLMMILSFSNLFGIKIAGTTVIVGVIFFFTNKARENQTPQKSGLDIRDIKGNFKSSCLWFWIMLPLIMNGVCIFLSKLLLPEYINHVLARTEILLSFDKILILLFQLAFLALGEEIAWWVFFQKQLGKILPFTPTLLISSALFAIGHFNQGKIVLLLYYIVFIFINSTIYGIIFHKTNNGWLSAISHFLANLFSIVVLSVR